MTVHKLLIALLLDRMTLAKLVAFSRDVETGMGADTKNFPSPPVALTKLHADTDLLEQTEANYKHDDTLKGARDAARADVEDDLTQLGQYAVQRARLVPPEQRAAVLASARFAQRKPANRNQPLFDLVDGELAGTLWAIVARKQIAKGHQKVFIYTQWSTDGTNWHDGPQGFKARQLITGLTSGAQIQVRWRAKIGDTLLDWSAGKPHTVK